MANAGRPVHETIDATGRSASTLAGPIAAAVGASGAYHAAAVGPGTTQFVRAYRPTWATVLGVLGLLFFGLGVLCFFVKRTETCTVTVVDGPRGAVVTITGRLLQEDLDRLLQVLRDGTDPAPAPSAVAPPAGSAATPIASAPRSVPSAPGPAPAPAPALPIVDDAERTVVARGRAATVVPAPPAWSLRFDHGAVVQIGSGAVVVGRDPSAHGVGDGAAVQLVAVPDHSMSVSKTHLVVRADGPTLVVEDLHSTNGTTVVHPSGEEVLVYPGQPLAVGAGAIIRFGTRRAEVLP